MKIKESTNYLEGINFNLIQSLEKEFNDLKNENKKYLTNIFC